MLNKLGVGLLPAVEVNRSSKSQLQIHLDIECEWYGQLYCSGDIVVDLYSWKFLKKCQDGKMGVYGRSWQEVAKDPRFKVTFVVRDETGSKLKS